MNNEVKLANHETESVAMLEQLKTENGADVTNARDINRSSISLSIKKTVLGSSETLSSLSSHSDRNTMLDKDYSQYCTTLNHAIVGEITDLILQGGFAYRFQKLKHFLNVTKNLLPLKLCRSTRIG